MNSTKKKLPLESAPHPDLQSAIRTLRLEAQALDQLSSWLGEPFVAALDLLGAVTGRIVVTGMGKSGHVAHKIAATLASTGSPAFFVHPAEASHGDLGMIAAGDAILALSNSGETTELADIIVYAKRYSIPLVAMTAKAGSALADAASVALILPPAREACTLDLAPTTSTTVMMALGDAIAVALYERKGFSAEDFQVFHPGGKLGRRLLKVGDIMHKGEEVPLAGMDTPMSDVLLLMTAKSFGCAGIVGKDGGLAGIITDGDLRRHMEQGLLGRKAGEVMTARPKTITSKALASEAVAQMNRKSRPVTCLFVVDEVKPVGIIHIHDCLRAGVA
jgi:arabinose-5-phosphate isomerase